MSQHHHELRVVALYLPLQGIVPGRIQSPPIRGSFFVTGGEFR
jgi:hypothetical protein